MQYDAWSPSRASKRTENHVAEPWGSANICAVFLCSVKCLEVVLTASPLLSVETAAENRTQHDQHSQRIDVR